MKTMRKLKATTFAIALAWLVPLAAQGPVALAAEAASQAKDQQEASNAIETVEFLPQDGGRMLLKLGMRKPVTTQPVGFTTANPPRIALDFIDTANALGKNNLPVNEALLRNVAIAQAGNRTRMVINLNKSVGYETRVEGKVIFVLLQGTELPTAASSNIGPRFAEATQGATEPHAVTNVDFRRGKDGEGRIVIELSDTSTGIDIRQQGKAIHVEFTNTKLPKSLERRLDVLDFGTPVQTIDTFSQGGNVKMVIEPKGRWEHSAYQTDRQFIVEIKQVIEDPNKLGGKFGFVGDKLSFNFQNIDVRAALQVIADFTGLNIVASDTVTGSLTLRLKDVPWDQALDIILQSKGLDMRKSGNVIRIAPADELATKEKLELEARQQISDLERTQIESFQLKFQKAEVVKKMLMEEKSKFLT